MKKLSFVLLTLSAAVFAKDAFKLIHTEDLAKMMSAKDSKVVVLDANSEATRKEDGIIAGAKVLSSFNKYDVAKELPTEKTTPIVFYCANPKCMASHAAAERACENGYKNVSVMADGIQGWKKAGKPTTKL